MCQMHTANRNTVLTLRGRERRTRVLAQLKVPADGAECPIALEPIQHAEVDGFEGFLFDAALPLHRELLLSCGHSFSASALVAHWLCNDMVCPLCRAGCASPLRVDTLPVAWRERATSYMRARDRRTAVEEALAESAETRFLHFALRITLHSPTSPHSFELNARCSTHIDMNQTLVQVSRAEMRNISATIQRTHAVGIEVALYVQAVGDVESLATAEGVVLMQSNVMLLPCAFWPELAAQRAPAQLAPNAVHHLQMTQHACRVTGEAVADARVVLQCTQHAEDNSALDTVTGIRMEVSTFTLLRIISDDEL